MSSIEHLLDKNKAWADETQRRDPTFFSQLAQQQTPKYLWIGCSDSRVPATQILNLSPGEVFVHRNVANLVVHTDLNCLSVIQYAVEALKVEHIIVCGHYGCGGIKAAMEDQQHGLVDNWLRHVKDVHRFHATELESLPPAKQYRLLCELNVTEQVNNICNTSIVANAWQENAQLAIHGWIYNLEDGILHPLMNKITSAGQLV
ncbi:MAG: carbonate dehydratase [Calditrichaeota bacterium]|nr:MAG: carbonate dehydratase [Calditrichota bacterium]